MQIMTTLPTTNGETTATVCDEYACERVDDVNACYTSMSRIVNGEHNLILHNFERVSQQILDGASQWTTP